MADQLRKDLGMYRQGDVLLIPTKAAAAGEPIPARSGRHVLLEGEATGHHHSIDARHGTFTRFRPDDMPSPGSIGLLVINGDGARLEHQEHDAIAIPPGSYEVRRQREFSAAEGFTYVKD